ncbi:MAG TPA: hypothetical protein ENK52_04755 [Saprospiraceae bacterium]|nr:hypothetical protein [Saprospiraceae bacterium]
MIMIVISTCPIAEQAGYKFFIKIELFSPAQQAGLKDLANHHFEDLAIAETAIFFFLILL